MNEPRSIFLIKKIDFYKIRKLITVYKNPTAGSYSESDESNPLSPTDVGRGGLLTYVMKKAEMKK
jgi:hypothetical protein